MAIAPQQRTRIRGIVRVGRFISLLLPCFWFGGGLAGAAQTDQPHLPTNASTSVSASVDHGAQAPSPHMAEIRYDGTSITVAADDSSLTQILHEIARQTGMKITGRIAEDRVFGTYGPASPPAILTTLLDGTGSNLFIVQDAAHRPTELVLTPRIGSATPPKVGSANSEDNEDGAPLALPIGSSGRLPSPAPGGYRAPYRGGGEGTNPAVTPPSSTSQQVVFPPINQSTPPATGTTSTSSPDPSSDAPKTPQQIFEQLQKLRQQQSQTPQ